MNKEYFKLTLSIAFPIAMQQLLSSTLSIIDQLMVGRLGEDVIAAIGLASKIPTFIFIVISALAQANSIMTSQYYGYDNKKGMSNVFNISTIFGFIFTLVTFILMISYTENIIIWFNPQNNNVISIACTYLRIFSIAFIIVFIKQNIISYLRSTQKIKYVVISGIVAVISNTILNYLLIYTFNLGYIGAVIATVICSFLELFILIYAFKKYNKEIKFQFKIPISIYKEFIFICLPLMMDSFLWGFGIIIYTKLYNMLGIKAFTVTSILNPYQTFIISFFTGFGVASSIITGNFLGQEKYDKAYDFTKWLIKNILFLSVLLSIISFIFIKQYIILFKISDELRKMTFEVMYVFIAFVPIKIINMIITGGILKSGGKTKITFAISFIATWLIGIPFGLLAIKLNLSLVNLIIFTNFEEIFKFIVGFYLFKNKKWIKRI